MSKFDDFSNEERRILKDALIEYEEEGSLDDTVDDMVIRYEMIAELDRIGETDDRSHDQKCPNTYGTGYVQADIPCPECDTHGWHPTKVCQSCGYKLCWCVENDSVK